MGSQSVDLGMELPVGRNESALYIYNDSLQYSQRTQCASISKSNNVSVLELVRNLMAHAQKPDFVFRLNGSSPFKLAGESGQSTVGSRGVRISVSNAGYTTFRGRVRVLATHSIRQFPFPCVTVCHHIPNAVYYIGKSWLFVRI